jgi:hypothetical protein
MDHDWYATPAKIDMIATHTIRMMSRPPCSRRRGFRPRPVRGSAIN